MPLPKVLTNLGAAEQAAARSLANVKTAVDPLLQLCNSTFDVATDGSLRLLRRIKTFTATTINATTSNTTGTATAGTSNTTGTATAANNVSASGFKATFDMGISWASNAVAGTRYQSKRFTQNIEANNTFNAPTLFQPLFAGSIIGVHMYSQGTAGGTFFTQLYKSNTIVASNTTPFITTSSYTASPQYVGYGVTYAKGTYPFAAMDYFSAASTFNTAGNQLVFISLYLEFGA